MRSFKIFTALASLFACSSLVAAQLKTIRETVDSFQITGQHPYGHGHFQSLVAKFGIDFDNNKNYTLFVPYNYALPDDTNAVSESLFKYHISTDVIPPQSTTGQVLANTLLLGTGSNNSATNLPAGLPQRLIVNYTSNANVTILSYGQDNTTSSDFVIQCSNGYIYFILSALKLPLPFAQAMNSNSQVGSLSDMEAAIAAATRNGVSDAILAANQTGLTFFAVNNDAYASVNRAENKNNPHLNNITYICTNQAVIGGVVAYTDYLNDHRTLVNAAGNTLNVTIANGVYYINGVQVIYANIPMANGVLHVMSRLFDDDSNPNTNKTKNGTTPTNGGSVTDVNNTNAAASHYATSSVAAVCAALSASALFLVFSL